MSSFFDLAAFIDVGFLKAEGARALGQRRNDVQLDARGCVQLVNSFVHPDQDARLLRTYWYDGAFDPLDPRHESQRRYFDAIASVPGIQLRLGHLQEITPRWQYALQRALERCGVDETEFEKHFALRPEVRQKGVDTLLTLDLVRLAQRGVYDLAILLAGDRDLAEPVRVAQDEGCKVNLLIPNGAGVATELRQLADEVWTLETAELHRMLRDRATG